MSERREAGVAVALSGGGHRAALFCLGALLYLVDCGRAKQVGSVASVSGGSLTNGWIAQTTDLSSITPAEFRTLVAPFIDQLANKGTLQGPKMSKRWRNLALAMLLLAFAVFALPNLTRWTRYLIFLGAVGVWALVAVVPLYRTRLARAYAWFLVVSGIAAIVTWWVIPLSYGGSTRWLEVTVDAIASPLGRLSAFVLSLVAWSGLVAARRGRVCAAAFRETLFTPGGTTTLLRAIHARPPDDGVDHVFCATDLQSAEHVYFGRDFVYGYRFGKGAPGDLPLYEAVQASANLPFAFPPKRLDAGAFRFSYQDPTGKCPESEDRPTPFPAKELVLTDGGVYDNMADQWAQGFDRRKDCWPGIDAEHHAPKELVVVNASAGVEWQRVRRARIPLVGEVLGLLKIKDVLYDQTTAHRRWAMIGRFDRAVLSGEGLRGAIVSIGQSPFATPDYFARTPVAGQWPERHERALAVRELLEASESREVWKAQARHDADVPTVLCAMEEADTASLLRHGYLLALANLHVVCGYPRPVGLPGIEQFRALARGDAGAWSWTFEPAEVGDA